MFSVKDNKPRNLKTTDELWDEIKKLSRYEHRSLNEQINYFLTKSCREFRKDNPDFDNAVIHVVSYIYLWQLLCPPCCDGVDTTDIMNKIATTYKGLAAGGVRSKKTRFLWHRVSY